MMAGCGTLGVWLVLHVGIGCAGTWLARHYALRRNLLDQPGARRSHSVATPRGGGIAIVASLLVALLAGAFVHPATAPALLLAATGLVLVAGIGWIDDHRPLSPWYRLAVHALAAGLLAAAVRLSGGSLAAALAAFASAVVLVNVWNFMDGIDGLAASQAALAGFGYALYAGGGPVLWLGLALAASSCGFLPFNLPRARIFLGDVGSGGVGYALAMLFSASLLAAGPDGIWLWAILLLPVSVFLVDASLTLVSRMLRGERWWEPHVQHAYQQLARRVGRHWPVTLGYGLATGAMVGLLLASRGFAVFLTFWILSISWLAWCGVWLLARCGRRTDADP